MLDEMSAHFWADIFMKGEDTFETFYNSSRLYPFSCGDE